ncbi:MAG: pantothenate kinase [Cyanobacteria bacterium P01_A01_bin.135]
MAQEQAAWLGLLIGNTQLQWGYFTQGALQQHWKHPHLQIPLGETAQQNESVMATLPSEYRHLLAGHRLWVASVVPQQTDYWRPYCQPPVTLAQVPLQGTYATLGIDRALALWGAGQRWGFPVLVVDGGTALTYTGADSTQALVGGAILPGLGLQMRSLHQGTAQLPPVDLSDKGASRWALTTEAAIWSGVFHSAIAGVEAFLSDWRRQYPHSPVVFTGGDGKRLHRHLAPALQRHSHYDGAIAMGGLQAVRRLTLPGARPAGG